MMKITINYNGRLVTVEASAEAAECLEEGDRKDENLRHEQQRTGMAGNWTNT